jgi:hypothetical protein
VRSIRLTSNSEDDRRGAADDDTMSGLPDIDDPGRGF